MKIFHCVYNKSAELWMFKSGGKTIFKDAVKETVLAEGKALAEQHNLAQIVVHNEDSTVHHDYICGKLKEPEEIAEEPQTEETPKEES